MKNTRTLPVEAEVKAMIDAIVAEWADKGKIIEGGWQGLLATSLQGAGEEQIREMRKAYWLGAQHLFASVISMLDSGAEPTDKDLNRMTLLHEELEGFRRSLGH